MIAERFDVELDGLLNEPPHLVGGVATGDAAGQVGNVGRVAAVRGRLNHYDIVQVNPILIGPVARHSPQIHGLVSTCCGVIAVIG